MKFHFNNINFLDFRLRKNFSSKINIITGIFGILLTFFDFNSSWKIGLFIIMLVILCLTYLVIYLSENFKDNLKLSLDDSEINIREGDIFSDSIYKNKDIIKVFAFNEYFDTNVNNEIISENSLNGQFINKEIKSTSELNNLNASIKDDERLNSYVISNDNYRGQYSSKKYKLGSVFKYSDDIFLTALTHFDKNNKAYLSIQDYIKFLVNFWDQIDELYANRTVVITLFGSGITRLEHKMFNNTQILQIILWTLSLRRIKFKKPAKFIILIDSKTNKNINYYKVKAGFNDLQK